MLYELIVGNNVAELETAEKEYDAAIERCELAITRNARKNAKTEWLYARARYFESLKNYTDYFEGVTKW